MKLKIISEDVVKLSGGYDEKIRTYECPCGKGQIIWSKEIPNGEGFGMQSTFSDVFFRCDDCESKYDFSTITRSVSLK